MLIVGCGCRGRSLAAALAADGHQVRGTTRDPARATDLDDGVVADPIRLGTLLPALHGVSAVCWLLGNADGDVAALHGPRLEALLETLVDTPVRGLVYEAAGRVDPSLLAAGARIVLAAGARFRMPVEVVGEDPADHDAWLAAMRAAVGRVLA